jgi:hypothetical protein
MAEASYRVTAHNDRWAVNHNGKVEGQYETREAAFEAIVGAASNSLRDGLGIVIEIPARATTRR